MTTENTKIEEGTVPTDSAGNNKSASPVETGNPHANRSADKGDNKDAMQHLDTTNTPSGKVEIINYVTDYVAGMTNDNAQAFYDRIKDEWNSKRFGNGAAINTTAGASIRAKGVAKEELEAVFASDDTLSEEFKTKAATLFEAALGIAITSATAKLEEENDNKLEGIAEATKTELTDRVGNFIEYVADSWLEKNQKAVETGIRVEAVDSFLEGMKTLFAEHYVSVPEDKVDVVENLTKEVEDLDAKLNEETAKNIELAKEVTKLRAAAVLEATLVGLSDTQKDRVRSMAESVDYSTPEEYQTKLTTIKEAVAVTNGKPVKNDATQDIVEDVEQKTSKGDPDMAAAVAALSRLRAR